MNYRKVKGSNNKGNKPDYKKLVDSKDLERNLLSEVSKELRSSNEKNRKNSSGK